MTGWRIGYTITNEDWTKAMTKLQSHSATHPTSFVQYACARALENREESMNAVSSMLAEYQKRRDWFIPALQEIEGLNVAMPEGAFYAFVDVRDLLGDRFSTSADFAEQLLNESHVVTTDGEGFGADGFLRFLMRLRWKIWKRRLKRLKSLFDCNANIPRIIRQYSKSH